MVKIPKRAILKESISNKRFACWKKDKRKRLYLKTTEPYLYVIYFDFCIT